MFMSYKTVYWSYLITSNQASADLSLSMNQILRKAPNRLWGDGHFVVHCSQGSARVETNNDQLDRRRMIFKPLALPGGSSSKLWMIQSRFNPTRFELTSRGHNVPGNPDDCRNMSQSLQIKHNRTIVFHDHKLYLFVIHRAHQNASDWPTHSTFRIAAALA